MERLNVNQIIGEEGQKVKLAGWVNSRRDHGKIIFLDLRDETGIAQIVITPKQEEAYKTVESASNEDVIFVEGLVNKRPKESINPDLETGELEVAAEEIKIIGKAEALPIPVEGEGYEIEEAIRFKYRYLDIRRPRLQKNLRLRSKAAKLVREFLDSKGFTEIETPYLSKSTPEGARDFLVPSRLQKGEFYALAQSPQQYKQLLMIAGFEKYYQLARAFRDEDLRSDRQFEHTQIDLEMAFVEREDVMKLVEETVINLMEKLVKKIAKKPFPIMSYQEAMDKYKTDRPDISEGKEDFHFLWVVDFPLFEKTQEGKLTFAHNPFASPKPDHTADLMNNKNLDSLQSLQYDLVCNGEEIGGGSIRIHDPEVQRQIFKVMGNTEKEIDDKFGHLLSAYQYGAPTHGGIALGFDRLVALICGEDNIREAIAFPVTSSGQTSVMDAPAAVDQAQLTELGLEVKLTPKRKEKAE